MKSVKQTIEEVFNNPTAPYRENWVLSYIEKELKRLKVPYFIDDCRNIIAGASAAKMLKKSARVALVAHTDHPGFHLTKRIKVGWSAKWFGGAPPKILNSRVAIYNPLCPDKIVIGTVKSKKLSKDRSFVIQIPNKE